SPFRRRPESLAPPPRRLLCRRGSAAQRPRPPLQNDEQCPAQFRRKRRSRKRSSLSIRGALEGAALRLLSCLHLWEEFLKQNLNEPRNQAPSRLYCRSETKFHRDGVAPLKSERVSSLQHC